MAVEVFIPPLDGYDQQQQAFGIEPEELAVIGLGMIGRVPDRYVKRCDDVPDYGFVLPYRFDGREFYLRGLYLNEADIDVVGIPRRPEELGAHLLWHQGELTRFQRFGFDVAQHFPVIVKDEDRWGECGYGIFTLVDAVKGTSLAVALKRHTPYGQKPAREAIGKLFDYYMDHDRMSGDRPIRDICYMRQFVSQCLVDVDPLRDNAEFPEELAHLSRESEQLHFKEGKRLHDRIVSEWTRQIDEIIGS